MRNHWFWVIKVQGKVPGKKWNDTNGSEGSKPICSGINRSQEKHKFYKKLYATRKVFVSRVEICRDKNGGILTDECEMIESWKQHYDEHLNGSEVKDQTSRRNGFIGTVDEGDVLTPTISEANDATK